VAFKDEKVKSGILSGLSANPNVISAQIYTPDMELFAEFKHPEKPAIEKAIAPSCYHIPPLCPSLWRRNSQFPSLKV
jgi:hypothetical protein